MIRFFLFTLLAFHSISHANPIVLEDFESGKLTWPARHPLSKKHPEYEIKKEGKNHFLRGLPLPTQEGNILYKQVTIDLKKTPYLTWRWRPIMFPTTANEGQKGKNDSAVGVYVYFQSGPLRRLLKYVWSANHPTGKWLDSPGSGWFWKTRILVLRTGPPTREWKEEIVDLKKDYTEAYGHAPSTNALGIAVLTDGDQTKSESVGDYDDFQALPEAPPKAQ